MSEDAEKGIAGALGLALVGIVLLVQAVIRWIQANPWFITMVFCLLWTAIIGTIYYFHVKSHRDKQLEKEIEAQVKQDALARKANRDANITKGLTEYTFSNGTTRWGTLADIQRWEEEDRKNTLMHQVADRIKSFEPSQKWRTEEGYQGELQGWLKSEFPESRVEVRRGSSRPDIVIEGIAIEVKGPTHHKDLQTVADKCIRYRRHFEDLIVVLFELRVNRRLFKEWNEGMKDQFDDIEVVII